MTFSAVLLAGGESQRMGRDKATIVFQRRPLWQRQLQILQELTPEKIFVSARTEPEWLPTETELLLDAPPSRGPLSGLANALLRMETTHLVALAVDMPSMTSAELRFLCGHAMPGSGVVPVIDECAQPLVAIYPREVLAELAAALTGTDFSLQPLIRSLAQSGRIRLIAVELEKRDVYRNVNEPKDLRREAPEPASG